MREKERCEDFKVFGYAVTATNSKVKREERRKEKKRKKEKKYLCVFVCEPSNKPKADHFIPSFIIL